MTSSYHSRQPHTNRSPGSESPTYSSGSGAATPTGTSASSSTFLSSSVSNLWGGLIRRFSTDTTVPTLQPSSSSSSSSSASPNFGSSFHQANTLPAGGLNGNGNGNGIDGVYAPPKMHRRTLSPMRPPPLEPLTLTGFRGETPSEARLLTCAIAEEIRIMVPARLSIVDEWELIYSLDQDGASLATLYDKCGKYEGRRVGFVLVVKDCEGAIFGAYLSDFPHPHPKYFGTGECFLWRASVMTALPPPPSAPDTEFMGRTTTIARAAVPRTSAASSSNNSNSNGNQLPNRTTPSPQPSPLIRFKAFPYSGVNEYYMLCETHFLSVGAGDGRYGLWLDDSLERGHSSTCLTFGNERLSDEGEKFGVLGVEVWVIGA